MLKLKLTFHYFILKNKRNVSNMRTVIQDPNTTLNIMWLLSLTILNYSDQLEILQASLYLDIEKKEPCW